MCADLKADPMMVIIDRSYEVFNVNNNNKKKKGGVLKIILLHVYG